MQRMRRWWPALVFIGAAGLMLWRTLIGGVFLPLDLVAHQHPWRFSYERTAINNENNSDLILQIYPRRVVANAAIAAGELPLWDPTILTGTPLLADGQLAFFYPPSLLFLLLPLPLAFGLYAWLQLALAGLGTYLFARRMGLAPGAALLAGLLFQLCGFNLTWLQFPEFSGAVAMLPWCFWAVARAQAQHSWRAWVLIGALLACVLVTQVQLAFYTLIGLGAWIIAAQLTAQSWTSRRQLLLGVGLALLVAAGLSAVQLVPQLALAASGQRPDAGASGVLTTAEQQMTLLLRTVFPGISPKPRTAIPRWGIAPLMVPQPYGGLTMLLLGGAALWFSHRRAATFFGLLALGAFVLAIGTPVLNLLLTLVPPYRQFTDHQRWFVLWGFGMAMLAGLGVDSLQSGAPATVRRWRLVNRLLLISILGVAGGVFLRHLALFTPESRYALYSTLIRQQRLGIVGLIGAASLLSMSLLRWRKLPAWSAVGLLVVIGAGDLLWHSGSYSTMSDPTIFHPTADLITGLQTLGYQPDSAPSLYPPTRQLAYLIQQPGPLRILGADYGAWPPNIAATWGLEDVRGYKSLYSARYNRLARLIDGKDPATLGSGVTSFRAYLTAGYTHRRLLDMLNVEYLLFPPGSSTPALYQPLTLVQQDDEGTIYRNPQALPRAWMVYATVVIPDDAAQLAYLGQRDFDPAREAIVAAAAPPLGAAPEVPITPTVTYTPNHATIQVETATPGMLVLADAYADGWQAQLDNASVPMYRTNYALRGVWVPAGTHQIRMVYRPQSLWIGGSLTVLTLLGIVAGLLAGWWSRRYGAISRA